MIAKNVDRYEMERALEKVNARFSGNVYWNRFEHKKNGIQFTLRVKDSKGPGHAIGYHHARRLTFACWHVHGYFFEALFEVNPNVVVYSRGKKITKDGGNWEDWNAGSEIYPLYMSNKCEC
jgi:hypothetical protein